MESESFAQSLYGQWDSFSRTKFENVVNDVLSRFETSGETIELEFLTIDLGNIIEEDFFDAFPKRLEEQLKDVFSAFLKDPQRHPKGFRIIPATRNRLELLSFYLQRGYLPWMADHPNTDFEQLFSELLKSDAETLKYLIRSFGENEKVRERLVYQLSDSLLESMVSLIEPGESNFINTYSRLLISFYPKSGHAAISRQNFRDAVLSLVFAYLLYPNRGYFNRKQFVRQTIYGLARRYNMNEYHLIDLFSNEIKSFTQGNTVLPELFLILGEIRKEAQLDGYPIGNKKDEREASQIAIHKDGDALLIPIKVYNLDDRSQPIDIPGRMEMNAVTSEVIHINNAGLVLLAPFFPHFFGLLNYLTDDRSSFRSQEIQYRMIFALQEFLSEEENFQESELALNKLLVGCPISDPLPSHLVRTDIEKQAVNDQCHAVLQYWEKMKNASLQGFKDAFLKRKGKLERQPNGWTLTVEEKPFDMLLDTLPWSYSLIKYKFMKEPIFVKWRN